MDRVGTALWQDCRGIKCSQAYLRLSLNPAEGLQVMAGNLPCNLVFVVIYPLHKIPELMRLLLYTQLRATGLKETKLLEKSLSVTNQ